MTPCLLSARLHLARGSLGLLSRASRAATGGLSSQLSTPHLRVQGQAFRG